METAKSMQLEFLAAKTSTMARKAKRVAQSPAYFFGLWYCCGLPDMKCRIRLPLEPTEGSQDTRQTGGLVQCGGEVMDSYGVARSAKSSDQAVSKPVGPSQGLGNLRRIYCSRCGPVFRPVLLLTAVKERRSQGQKHRFRHTGYRPCTDEASVSSLPQATEAI